MQSGQGAKGGQAGEPGHSESVGAHYKSVKAQDADQADASAARLEQSGKPKSAHS